MLTLGSIFDGSGGFPLGALLNDILPLWASEIEPFPIRVTTKRLPFMTHLGDIRKINGAAIPPVDIISFGSPCVDMSVAGNRAGLDGKHSSLYHEAIRVIKEMRKATNGQYPRIVIWENVPGAFSSNAGNDFHSILSAITKIKDKAITVPMPEKNKWMPAGAIMATSFSLAWRTLDAQFWGVPQRRKRVYLVGDFDGDSAGKILFEFERLSGYSPQGFRTGADTPSCSCKRSGISDFKDAIALENHPMAGRVTLASNNIIQTLTNRMGTGGNNIPLIIDKCYSLQGKAFGRKEKNAPNGLGINENVSFTLNTIDRHAVAYQSDSTYMVRALIPSECALLQGFPSDWCSNLETENPTEQEIDWWLDVFENRRLLLGKSNRQTTRNYVKKWLKNPHTDAQEYRLWGNGVALPNVCFVMAAIKWVLEN